MRLAALGLLACLAARAALAADVAGRFPACRPGAGTQRVTFIHYSDLHGHYGLDAAGSSPYARLRGYFEAVRSSNPYTILTDGGDHFEKGSIAEHFSRGRATAEAARAMRPDVRTLGNHDFAWDEDLLLDFSRSTETLILAGNLKYGGPDPGRFGAREYGELKVGCLTVGFFGLVERSWSDQDEPSDAPYYSDIAVRSDFVELAREIVSRRRAGVQLLVMVSHLGLEADERIAAAVPGIDLILGGHTHDILWDAKRVGNSWIVQAGQDARLAARVDADFDLAASSLTRVSSELVPNKPGLLPVHPGVERAVEAALARWGPGERGDVGRALKPLDKKGLGALAMAAARSALKADAALIDYKTIWARWTPGGVDLQGLYDTFKVEREPPNTSGFSSFCLARVNGSDLAKIRDARDPARFGFSGPKAIEPGRTYLLALQKRQAHAPGLWLPAGVSLKGIRPAGEVWEAVERYARDRAAKCLHLDADAPVEGCGPR